MLSLLKQAFTWWPPKIWWGRQGAGKLLGQIMGLLHGALRRGWRLSKTWAGNPPRWKKRRPSWFLSDTAHWRCEWGLEVILKLGVLTEDQKWAGGPPSKFLTQGVAGWNFHLVLRHLQNELFWSWHKSLPSPPSLGVVIFGKCHYFWSCTTIFVISQHNESVSWLWGLRCSPFSLLPFLIVSICDSSEL